MRSRFCALTPGCREGDGALAPSETGSFAELLAPERVEYTTSVEPSLPHKHRDRYVSQDWFMVYAHRQRRLWMLAVFAAQRNKPLAQ